MTGDRPRAWRIFDGELPEGAYEFAFEGILLGSDTVEVEWNEDPAYTNGGFYSAFQPGINVTGVGSTKELAIVDLIRRRLDDGEGPVKAP